MTHIERVVNVQAFVFQRFGPGELLFEWLGSGAVSQTAGAACTHAARTGHPCPRCGLCRRFLCRTGAAWRVVAAPHFYAMYPPPLQGIHPGGYKWSPTPGNSRCERTQHTAPHSRFTGASATAVAVPGCLMSPKSYRSTVRHVVVLAGYSGQGLHPSPCPYPPPLAQRPLCATTPRWFNGYGTACSALSSGHPVVKRWNITGRCARGRGATVMNAGALPGAGD